MSGQLLYISGLLLVSSAFRCIGLFSLPRGAFIGGWLIASVGAVVGFFVGLAIWPPDVFDPTTVAIQLPFLGGGIGAVVEIFFQIAQVSRKSILTSAAHIVVLLFIAGLAVLVLLAYYSLAIDRPGSPPAPTVSPKKLN